MTGHYTQTTDAKVENGEPRKKGQKIYIFAGQPPSQEEVDNMDEKGKEMVNNSIYIDTDELYIDVKLQADNQADEQSRLNLMINSIDKLGMSRKEAWERMGWSNYDINSAQTYEEALEMAELQNQLYARSKEEQDKLRQVIQEQLVKEQEQAAAEQAQSQETTTNQLNAGSQFANLQGVDMRSGSMPASMVAPMEGRNQVNGSAP